MTAEIVTVYEPRVQPGYEWVAPELDTDHEVFWSLDGTPLGATWRRLPVVRFASEGRDGGSVEADLPWLGTHVLVLRPRAVDVLGPVLVEHGELLPLACQDADLWLFNVLTVVDALDEERSDLVRFDEGNVMEVRSCAFVADRVVGLPVFKVPQLLRWSLYFGQDFARLITRSGLTGLGLAQVWSDSG
ncbi:imm11 family protein [Actinokineospora sp. 24-640]